MRKYLWIGLLLCGCKSEKVIPVPKVVEYQNMTVESTIGKHERDLTDKDKIALLRAEAKKRNLQWRVFCTKFYADEPDGFQGTAWHRGEDRIDETHDRWMQAGKTQADAAYALYTSIQGAPTHPGRPKEQVEKERRPYMCPVHPLSSE